VATSRLSSPRLRAALRRDSKVQRANGPGGSPSGSDAGLYDPSYHVWRRSLALPHRYRASQLSCRVNPARDHPRGHSVTGPISPRNGSISSESSPQETSSSAASRLAEPPVGTRDWAKAIALGVVAYLATSIGLAFVGVPYFGLFGYLVGAVIVGRIVHARTWPRWVAAFGLLFAVVVTIGIVAVGILMATRPTLAT
jgi:hypothetical protein